MTKNQFKCVSTELSVFGMYMLISQRLFMSSSFNLFRILSIPHSVNLLPLEYQLEDSIYIYKFENVPMNAFTKKKTTNTEQTK